MADGYRLKVPGVATGTGFKILSVDPVLPRQGALLLLDPAHPADPVSGLPAADAFIPNIAWESARAMVGSGDRLSLGVQRKSSGTLTGAAGKLERSSKGGIHGIASQTAMVAGAIERLEVSDMIKGYLLANPGNDLYFSIWWSQTRDWLNITGNRHRVFALTKANAADSTQSFRCMFCIDGAGTDTAQLAVYPDASAGAPQHMGSQFERQVAAGQPNAQFGWRRQGTGNSDWTLLNGKTMPVSVADMQMRVGWGRSGSAIVGDTGAPYTLPQDQAGSFILQRLYIEDLTVSGRTWTAVDALDKIEHDKHVKNVGGRYYGDTFVTDPASIP